MSEWQFQTAKARLSEVFRAAETEGPQIVTVRGKKRFVVAIADERGAAEATSGLDLFRSAERIDEPGLDEAIAKRHPAGARPVDLKDRR